MCAADRHFDSNGLERGGVERAWRKNSFTCVMVDRADARGHNGCGLGDCGPVVGETRMEQPG